MKKLIIVVLSVVLALSLAACSGSGKITDPVPTQGIAEDLMDLMTDAPAATEVPVLTPTPDILDETAQPTVQPQAE